jgi:hypothetical protein
MGAPSFVDQNHGANFANSGTVSITIPSGITDGDGIVAIVGVTAGTGLDTPAGWTLIGGGAARYAVFAKVAASESGSYTFTCTTGTGFMDVACAVWHPDNPYADVAAMVDDYTETAPVAAGTAQDFPALTLSAAPTTVVYGTYGDNNSDNPWVQVPPSGGTNRSSEADGFVNTQATLGDFPEASAGAEGPFPFTAHNGFSQSRVNFSLALGTGAPPPAPPTITSVVPDAGPVFQVVGITGTNFDTANAVDFNGTPAASFTIDSATHITATVAAGSTTGDVHVTNPSGTASYSEFVVTSQIPPASLPYRSPAWRFVVLDLVSFETLSFLDHLASGRVVTYTLDAAAQAEMVVPSDNPEINIPWPDPNSDPFLAEGSRVLYGFRRDGVEPEPWTPRFAGIIMQLEDAAQSDQAYSHLTAFDPWEYLKMRPVCNIDGSLPGINGISFTSTTVDQIIGELLRNTIENQGPVGIDMGSLYGGTAFYDGTIETGESISINFPQGTMLGDAWTQLTNQNDCDITLTPIYDPINRPGYLVQANVYNQAGSPRDDAIFAWDMPSRSLVQISRLIDGTLRANVVKFFSGLGGSATDGSVIPAQVDIYSVDKFGEYWRQQFFPAQNIADIVKLLAQAELALSKNGRTTVTISPAPERSPIPFDDYFLGDLVPVYASNRLRAPLAGYQRIYGIPLNIADDATESVQQLLTTEPAST